MISFFLVAGLTTDTITVNGKLWISLTEKNRDPDQFQG
jgi:hypothetical protein